MSRCAEYEKMMCLQSNCEKCKELGLFDSLMNGDAVELPKIDMGQAVTPEEKQGLTDNALIWHGEPKRSVLHSDKVIKMARDGFKSICGEKGLDGYNS
jgi:hypothetical protein